jgi:glutamate 5-kinase
MTDRQGQVSDLAGAGILLVLVMGGAIAVGPSRLPSQAAHTVLSACPAIASRQATDRRLVGGSNVGVG